MKNIRTGVINWDASLPPETYFGYYQTRTLSPAKYRYATPFYADIVNENKITYHYRTPEEYEKELTFAIEAGIDYFAYVFYPDKGSRDHISLEYKDCSHRVYELNFARKLHEQSRLSGKIGMCSIVNPGHPYDDCDIDELVLLMGMDYYEKIAGRPLVYLFHSAPARFIDRINTACQKSGVPKPFYVSMLPFPKDGEAYDCIDGLSSYACFKGGIENYSQLCDEMIYGNSIRQKKCLEQGLSVVPHFTAGWDPSPRVDIPSPWVSYENTSYHSPATSDELYGGGVKLCRWIKENCADNFSGHIMTFAWNEFEEGGWICPTYNADLSVNTDRIKVMKKLAELWKTELGSMK